jgi:hypothetical protein
MQIRSLNAAEESRRFTYVFLEDVGRHRGRCAHLPHKSLEDVNLYFEIAEVFLFENRLLHLPGFCVGGAHISHDVFQHLPQIQEQKRYLDLCVGFIINLNQPLAPTV